jgi:uncharacterized protein YbjT (DUF2867 family)
MKTALIAGSTGLVGKQLLSLLLSSPEYSKVIALTRRTLDITNPKLSQILTDLSSLDENAAQLRADDIFCCLGTTMAKAGSKEKFFEVDYSYPVRLAEMTKKHGAKQFLLVSAMGANKKSAIYYNSVKGQVEESLLQIGFESLHILRPSLLLGDREETRFGEDVGKIMFKSFGFLIPGKYKGIDASRVAEAMLYFATQERKGNHIHPSDAIRNLPRLTEQKVS